MFFSFQWNTWHHIFSYQSATDIFHSIGKIFTHPSLSVIFQLNLKHSHWQLYSGDQTDCNEGSWQSPSFTEHHTSYEFCILQAPKCFYWLCPEVSFCQIGTQGNTEELCDNEQEDVVDPAVVYMSLYCLGGSDTSETLVEEDAGCAGYMGGGTWFDSTNACIGIYWKQ